MPRRAVTLCYVSTILLAAPAAAQIAPTGTPAILYPPAAGYEAETPIHLGAIAIERSGGSASQDAQIGTSPLPTIMLPYGFNAGADRRDAPAQVTPIIDVKTAE